MLNSFEFIRQTPLVNWAAKKKNLNIESVTILAKSKGLTVSNREAVNKDGLRISYGERVLIEGSLSMVE
jgi:hypothetical protein